MGEHAQEALAELGVAAQLVLGALLLRDVLRDDHHQLDHAARVVERHVVDEVDAALVRHLPCSSVR